MSIEFERIIRRVKSSMRYLGSYSTRDILGSLVVRWIHSGEWDRLKQLPAEQRHIGQSVRRFILDRIDSLRRRGEPADLPDDLLALPEEVSLQDMIDEAEMRLWIDARIVDLEAGVVDERIKIPVANPEQIGHALRLYVGGNTQRQIAARLGVSVGLVNRRLSDGTNYLVVLQAIEQGVGVQA
jgi:hypothetical protein